MGSVAGRPMNGTFSPIASSTGDDLALEELGPDLLLVERDRGVELFELRTRHGRFRGALREQLQHLRIRERREGRGHQRPDAFVDDALDRILAASCSGSGAP